MKQLKVFNYIKDKLKIYLRKISLIVATSFPLIEHAAKKSGRAKLEIFSDTLWGIRDCARFERVVDR